jgi:hypothetical protein
MIEHRQLATVLHYIHLEPFLYRAAVLIPNNIPTKSILNHAHVKLTTCHETSVGQMSDDDEKLDRWQ